MVYFPKLLIIKWIASLNTILKENNIDLMLSPILSDKQIPLDINIFNLTDYSVTFYLHKKPSSDLKGISSEDSYKFYEIIPNEETIENEVKNLKTKYGKFIPYEGDIKEETIITISASELAQDQIKDKGYDTEFTIKVSEITDKYKKTILKLKSGASFDFDIYDFIINADEKKVRDYILNLDEKDFKEGEDINIGKMFPWKIKKTESFEFAELMQSFSEILKFRMFQMRQNTGIFSEKTCKNSMILKVKNYSSGDS